MSFLYDLNKKAKAAATVAGEKAREMADSAKLTAEILSERRELDKHYRAIGQWFVCENQENVPAAIADIVASVRSSQARIQELEALRDGGEEAPKGEVCPVCGDINQERFCPKCGAPMPRD